MSKQNKDVYKGFYNDLYNPDLKIKFIKESYPNEDTKIFIFYIFKKSASTENFYNKDVCVFNSDEILDLVRRLNYNTQNALESAMSVFATYVDWCIANDFRGKYENNINDFELFIKTQDLSQFLSKLRAKNRYLTKEEVHDMVDYLYNFQDKATILAMYEGILGESAHELRLLTTKDIDIKSSTVKLIDADGTIRTKKISSKLVGILLNASEETEYYQDNGEAISKSTSVRKLAETPYVIKPVRRGYNNDEPLGYGSFSQRIVRIKKYVEYPFITASTLYNSGAINRVLEITDRLGLKEPNDEVFRVLKLDTEYNMSDGAIYRLKQTFQLANSLKEF